METAIEPDELISFFDTWITSNRLKSKIVSNDTVDVHIFSEHVGVLKTEGSRLFRFSFSESASRCFSIADCNHPWAPITIRGNIFDPSPLAQITRRIESLIDLVGSKKSFAESIADYLINIGYRADIITHDLFEKRFTIEIDVRWQDKYLGCLKYNNSMFESSDWESGRNRGPNFKGALFKSPPTTIFIKYPLSEKEKGELRNTFSARAWDALRPPLPKLKYGEIECPNCNHILCKDVNGVWIEATGDDDWE